MYTDGFFGGLNVAVVAANCESFHNIESINYDVPFPCDIYEDKAFKIKPFKGKYKTVMHKFRHVSRKHKYLAHRQSINICTHAYTCVCLYRSKFTIHFYFSNCFS